MTNSWTDIGVSGCVLIMGSNAAENHPVAMKWVLRAKDRGGKIIHVDPRFTRTSAKADIYAPLRSGTDIAFLGGMINYILEKDLIQNDYVVSNTNAAFIVNPKYDFKDGLFSGYNPEKRAYDKSLWAIEKDEKGIPKRDQSLQNERCVYQLMKKHYARYDLNSVSNITGTPKEDLIKVYEAYAETGKPDKVGTMLYAMGWTQHTVGTQNIRAASIIQLLLGNMGMAGGGVNALRGESNVQGITDQAVLFHIIPGYNPSPKASDVSLEKYNEKNTPKTANPSSVNWWGNRPKYIASFLKSMYGEREGSLSDSARTAQWRYKAIEPIGESKADGQIIHEIYMKLKTLYEKDKGVFPDPILKLKWDYAKAGKVDTHLVAKDINGYFLEDVPEHPVDKKA